MDYGAVIPAVITIDILSSSDAVMLLKCIFIVQYRANKELAKAVPQTASGTIEAKSPTDSDSSFQKPRLLILIDDVVFHSFSNIPGRVIRIITPPSACASC